MMGANDVLHLAGDRILQAQSPEMLLSTIGGQIAAGSGAAVAFAAPLARLDAAGAEGEIVQAAMFGPGVVPPAGPTQALAGIAPADLPAAIERLKAEGAVPGILPVLGGLLADIRTGDVPTLAIALLYPDCFTAEVAGAAAAGLRAAPRASDAVPPDGQAVATITANGEGIGCAAVVTVTVTADPASPFDRAASKIVMRDFSPLRIAWP